MTYCVLCDLAPNHFMLLISCHSCKKLILSIAVLQIHKTLSFLWASVRANLLVTCASPICLVSIVLLR